MVLAALSSGLIFVAVGLYIHSLLRGRSQPYVWAWVIRTGLVGLAFTAQLAEGARYSLALYGAQLAGGIAIVVLIICTQQRKGRLDRVDIYSLFLAVAGLIMWLVSGEALYAILGTILADGSATWMGIRAALYKGKVESLPFWSICLGAASAGLLSTGTHNPVIILAPACSCFNALANIAVIAYIRRREATYIPATEFAVAD